MEAKSNPLSDSTLLVCHDSNSSDEGAHISAWTENQYIFMHIHIHFGVVVVVVFCLLIQCTPDKWTTLVPPSKTVHLSSWLIYQT